MQKMSPYNPPASVVHRGQTLKVTTARSTKRSHGALRMERLASAGTRSGVRSKTSRATRCRLWRLAALAVVDPALSRKLLASHQSSCSSALSALLSLRVSWLSLLFIIVAITTRYCTHVLARNMYKPRQWGRKPSLLPPMTYELQTLAAIFDCILFE